MEPKFKIGDVVANIKTGFPNSGRVVGILSGEVYYNVFIKQIPTIWDEIFPEWKSNCVYYIEHSTPIKSLTFDEFCKSVQNRYKDAPITYTATGETFAFQDLPEASQISFLKEQYNNIPLVSLVTYPENDLELFEL